MKKTDLNYHYPEELIATVPSRPSRVMWVEGNHSPKEITIPEVLNQIPAGDILVINDTKVLKRRVFAKQKDFVEELEILFLEEVNQEKSHWQVLFPSKKFKVNDEISLPFGFKMKLLEKGRPQKVEVTPALTEADFEKMAELPLPPYIQKARSMRHNVAEDSSWYQTAWASIPGSQAAPTASLHFSAKDIQFLKDKGVQIVTVTLHVGLGTFLPLTAEDLNDHDMHSEVYLINPEDWDLILKNKEAGRKIWALGTTATRVLESVARTGKFSGETNLLLQEGSEFFVVDRLMTNFHQPESTLLALVSGFAGLTRVKQCYQWAIDHKFKLFSYGDFSVWLK